MCEVIKDNMEICIEYNCFNFKKAGDEYCIQCCYEQQTENEFESFNEFIEGIIKDHIHENIIYDIIDKNNKKISIDNIFNNTKRYICKLNNIKILTLDDISNRLISYKPIKKSPEQRKRQKEINKFNDKYNKLLIINKKYIKWADDNLITDFYKNDIINIINKHMYFFNEKINKNGKFMEDLRNTYRYIYDELYNNWEMKQPYDEDDKKDEKIVLKQQWLDYAIYEDEDYKKMLKI